MNIFSEIYGCYYNVIEKILNKAQEGMTKKEIEQLIQEEAFEESAFHILPKLYSGEWDLLEQKSDGKYYAKPLLNGLKRPLTNLEKSWLQSLLEDERIYLFLTQDEVDAAQSMLGDTAPLFLNEDFYTVDLAEDGDAYSSTFYIQCFQTILHALHHQKMLLVHYRSGYQQKIIRRVLPYKLNYSSKDEKFRLIGICKLKSSKIVKTKINLSRIERIETIENDLAENLDIPQILAHSKNPEPIVLQIFNKRNALERTMMEFASWQKITEYDEEKDCYFCKIYYDKDEETELLIRILSFGPVVKVLGPAHFLAEIKERIQRQNKM